MAETFSVELERITEAVVAAIPAAAAKAMAHLHQVAVDRTPLQDGNLRGWSYVESVPGGANVVYPGPYARYQHYEILRHEVGQRLYLSSAVLSETPKVLEILATELRKEIQ